MHLSDLIAPDRVIVDLRTGDKTQLLGELARQAAARISVGAQAIFAALSARERLGSTGFGRGFALPHARVDGVDQLFGLFARLAHPIDFAAVDGEPVDLVFLLLIPPGAGNHHVGALAAIARKMRDESALQEVRKANSAPRLYRILADFAP